MRPESPKAARLGLRQGPYLQVCTNISRGHVHASRLHGKVGIFIHEKYPLMSSFAAVNQSPTRRHHRQKPSIEKCQAEGCHPTRREVAARTQCSARTTQRSSGNKTTYDAHFQCAFRHFLDQVSTSHGRVCSWARPFHTCKILCQRRVQSFLSGGPTTDRSKRRKVTSSL